MTTPTISYLKGPGPPPGLTTKARTRWAAKNPPKDPTISFATKTVLITGSNTGLGYQAAQKFAALGALKVVLGVRNISKGETAKANIVQAVGCPAQRILVMQVDMSSFESVKSFASRINKEVEKLDVVLLNAGIAAFKYELSPEGYESALQINILSTALFAILLLPKLRNTASITGHASQLTFTGSAAHVDISATDFYVESDESILEKLNDPGIFDQAKSYSVIKLLTMYVMQGIISDFKKKNNKKEDKSGDKLGDKLPLDVTVNVTCPGFCKTDLGREWPWYVVYSTRVMQMYYGRSAEEGSRSLVSACALGVEGHGGFWTNDVFMEPGVMVTSEEGKALQIRTWEEILRVLEKEVPGIRSICSG